MNLAEVYPWLKALHIAAALVFVSGVLAVAIFLRSLPKDNPRLAAHVRSIRRWDRLVTTPAMLLVWRLGLTLALTGHWFAAGWLQVKLVLVIILSGLHGVQSGRLRRVGGGTRVQPSYVIVLIVGCSVGIAVLAIVKPWG